MNHRHNVYDLLGVSGPGDEWMSVGPGGMSSIEAQHAAAKQPSSQSMFGAFFGDDEDDEELLVAESGAAADAAEAAIHFADAAAKPAPSGGGGSVFTPAPAPSPVPVASTAPSSGLSFGGSLGKILIAGAAVGLVVYLGSK